MITLYGYTDSLHEVPLDQFKAFTGKLWIDITNLTKEEAVLIKEKYDLHQLTIEDLRNKRTRIKVEEFTNYLFCVIYTVEQKRKIQSKEIDLVLGKDFIISNHQEPIHFIEEIKANPQGLSKLFSKGVEYLFHKIIDETVDHIFPAIAQIDMELEELEKRVNENPNKEVIDSIFLTKRKISVLRRLYLSQREKIQLLAKTEYSFISKKSLPYFRDIYDHATRIMENLESQREAVTGIYEMYMSALSLKMNEVMKVLSIIATIALPLTVISGVYGTNFVVLPGAGSPLGFWIMILFMIILCAGMLVFFRHKKWI